MKKILSLLLIFLFCTKAWAVDYCADSNMKGAWKMEETSGNLLDCTSNANNCVPTSITQGSTDKKFGTYAVDIPQTNNNKLDCGSAASLDNFATLSTGGWFAPDDQGETSTSRCNAGNFIQKSEWGLCFRQTNRRAFYYRWSFGQTTWSTPTAPYVPDGTYHHEAVTYNGGSTANDPIIYVDGTSQTIGDVSPGGTRNSDATDNLLIGLGITDINELNSRADEVFYYNGILTSTQINDIKDNGLTPVATARRVFLVS